MSKVNSISARKAAGRLSSDFRRSTFDFRPRSGYTLMEILLVLAIMVIAAAAVGPSFRGMMRGTALSAAANEVRGALTKAHVKAMKTGRTQVFYFEQGGAKFKVEPYLAADDELESAQGDPSSPLASSGNTQNNAPEKTLPEGTKFASGDVGMDTRSQRIEQELDTTGGSGATWSRPILFFPDGSALDAFIVVGNDHNQGIRLDLRGMTSAVKVSDVSNLKSLEGGQL